MSTLKSSSTDLTINADGVGNDIIFQSNAGQVGSLTAEGVLTATSFAGSAAALTGLAGEVTGTAGSNTIADNVVDEANLKVSNSPTNGYVLTAQSGNTGGLTWAADSTTDSSKMPLAGGQFTGNVTFSGSQTVEGVDISASDAVLTSTTTTAGAALPKAGGTMTGAITTLSITETETTKSSSFTPNLSTDGTIFDVSGSITITMPSATAGKSFTIIDSGSGTLSWSGTIKWPSGTAPSPSGATIYSFISNGTNWYGMMAGTGFA